MAKTMKFSGNAVEELDKIAAKLNISTADMIRNAISLYAFVNDPKCVAADNEIAIIDSEGAVKKIINVPGRKTV